MNDEKSYKTFPNVSDVEKLYVLSPLCNSLPKYLDDYIELHNLKGRLADADARFWRMANRYAPKVKDVLENCSWRRYDRNCTDLFDEVLTDDGICFSFNLQNASELYKEDLMNEHYHLTRHNKPSYYWNNTFPPNTTAKTINESDIYPRRVLTGSEGLRFQLLLPQNDIDYKCSGPVQSFKIQLHSADDIPQMHRNFYRIPMKHDIIMSVHPNIMNCTEKLLTYKDHERQCQKASYQIHFFKKYTQRNCQLSEISRRQHDTCGCVEYGVPRYKNQKICRSNNDAECINHVEGDTVSDILNGTKVSYNCMPACSSISYDAEISMSKFEDRQDDVLDPGIRSNVMKNIDKSRVLITFKDEQFFASRRAEMYSWVDFIASAGGILGLFMGFSILSIVEIVYFSTLRIGCSLRKRRRAKRRRLKQLKIIDELNGGNGEIRGGSAEHSEYDNLPKITY